MIRIRELQAEDWPAVFRIHDAARPDELAGSCDSRAFVPLRQDPELAELKQCHILIAHHGGTPVGFAGVDDDYLGWLYVHPDWYRRGIGRQLLQAGLKLTSGTPWTIVLAGNKPAIRLYRSEGFVEVARFASENAGYPCTCIRMAQRPAANS